MVTGQLVFSPYSLCSGSGSKPHTEGYMDGWWKHEHLGSFLESFPPSDQVRPLPVSAATSKLSFIKVYLRSVFLLQALTLVHIKISLSPTVQEGQLKAKGLEVKLDNRRCVLHAPRPEFDAQLRGKDSNKHRGKMIWKILRHYKKLCSWKTQKLQLPLLPDTYASSKDKWDIIYQQISLDKLGELWVTSNGLACEKALGLPEVSISMLELWRDCLVGNQENGAWGKARHSYSERKKTFGEQWPEVSSQLNVETKAR